MSGAVLDDLDDLCVLLLFSVFEALVRDQVLRGVDAEIRSLRHPTLRRAADDARDAIEQGSFFKVLEPYKEIEANLIELVNQVRRYRNWVAHGRRGPQPGKIDPDTAFVRLTRLLGAMQPPDAAPAPTGSPGPAGPS